MEHESIESFLEPIYLNEKMVLNCAAYIFKGYTLESEVRDQTESERSRSVKAGLTFLEKLISIGGEVQSKQSQAAESKSARRYTIGGLHMSLIDELYDRVMLQAIDPHSLENDLASASSYVEMPAILKPVDFYALIDTLRISSPIVREVLKTFVGPWYGQRRKQDWANLVKSQQKVQLATPARDTGRMGSRGSQASAQQAKDPPLDGFQLALTDIDKYVSGFDSVLKQLEDDYRRSKQVEFVMWTNGKGSRPYGVVDLDLGDNEPEELRAKLSGGAVRVVGKVTRQVGSGESINLLQKSALFSALSLVNRIVEESGETDALMQYRSGLHTARNKVEQFVLLEVPGPAVRVAAMSVCI